MVRVESGCTTGGASRLVGIGDEIMATAQARRMQQKDPRKVQVVDRFGRPRFHPIWEGNPRIARSGESGDFQLLMNAPGCRPYIVAEHGGRWEWRDFDCEPGEIYLTGYEKRAYAGRPPVIVIEPTLKMSATRNKDWGLSNWRRFIMLAGEAGYSLSHLRPRGTRCMDRVRSVLTPDFRSACAALMHAKAYVGHEGALHHAAAALGIPAVVIFGGFISPAQTGYKMHRNLFTGGEPCGKRLPCQHCAAAMAAITPERVLEELKGITG